MGFLRNRTLHWSSAWPEGIAARRVPRPVGPTAVVDRAIRELKCPQAGESVQSSADKVGGRDRVFSSSILGWRRRACQATLAGNAGGRGITFATKGAAERMTDKG